MAEAKDRPGFVRCVHPDKGVGYFRKETSEKPSWQHSTGWRPQVVEKAPAPVVVEPDVSSHIPTEPKAPKSDKPKATADSI